MLHHVQIPKHLHRNAPRVAALGYEETGQLLFSAFSDSDLDGFEDRSPESPLHHACFGRATMEALIGQAGWAVDSFHEREPQNCIMDHFVCSLRAESGPGKGSLAS